MRLIAGGEVQTFQLRELQIASRLGNTARRIAFPDGGTFETLENEAVDAALARLGSGSGSRALHRLETRIGFVLAALAIVALSVWSFLEYGIPAVAKAAAFSLPPEANGLIGREALEIMDRTHLDASALDEGTRARIRDLFAGVTRDAPEGYDFDLHFRRGGGLGANAFALPSGAVVVTDELVALTEHDAEMIALLAHEVGHVVQRHVLRRAIQDSLVAGLVILVTGEPSAISSLVAVIPTLLVETRFSRAFEFEADGYALAHLQREGIDPTHFANLMRRLGNRFGEAGTVSGFFSTHPPSEERVRRFANARRHPGAP